jgi:uncharacterized beta-barrel protein YwiB (DUF1934 family)
MTLAVEGDFYRSRTCRYAVQQEDETECNHPAKLGIGVGICIGIELAV